jgi:hypothetical protein
MHIGGLINAVDVSLRNHAVAWNICFKVAR